MFPFQGEKERYFNKTLEALLMKFASAFQG